MWGNEKDPSVLFSRAVYYGEGRCRTVAPIFQEEGLHYDLKEENQGGGVVELPTRAEKGQKSREASQVPTEKEKEVLVVRLTGRKKGEIPNYFLLGTGGMGGKRGGADSLKKEKEKKKKKLRGKKGKESCF